MFGEYGWLVERLAGLVSAYAITFLLTEGRFGRKATVAAFAGGLVVSEAILCTLFALGGAETFSCWYPLAANVPVLALQFAVSRQRPLVVVLVNLTAMQMNGIIALTSRVAANAALGMDPTLVNLIVRPLVAVPLLVALCRWFRPLFLEVARTLRRGWGLLCLMLAFYAQFYLAYVRRVVYDPALQLAVIGLAMVLMMAAFGVVFVFFDEHAKRRESAEGQRALATQVNALERQVDAVRSADERLRIVRHDLRHHLASVLANALENALAACERQPDGEPRRIEVRCVSALRFALEVANTCSGPVAFDGKGRPMAQEPGHGTGTRSIAAFAEKHGARLFYDAPDDEGLFRLQLLMPVSTGL